MNLSHITYQGPKFDSQSTILDILPKNLLELLKQINGFIQYDGGLHIRGVCNDPAWHSLDQVMQGDFAIHKLYSQVKKDDIPFGQDCVADQFILRDRVVYKLQSETGILESLDMGLGSFLKASQENPVEFLSMEPLLQLHKEGLLLKPGEVIHVYPPFCTKESANGVSLKPIPTQEALSFLSDFAKQVNQN
jgi:hypothetical protein